MVNFDVKWALHYFNTLLFNKAKEAFSSVVYAILQCKKTDILEPNPGSCRTRTEPNLGSPRSVPLKCGSAEVTITNLCK